MTMGSSRSRAEQAHRGDRSRENHVWISPRHLGGERRNDQIGATSVRASETRARDAGRTVM
jgi:hypothetical protein